MWNTSLGLGGAEIKDIFLPFKGCTACQEHKWGNSQPDCNVISFITGVSRGDTGNHRGAVDPGIQGRLPRKGDAQGKFWGLKKGCLGEEKSRHRKKGYSGGGNIVKSTEVQDCMAWSCTCDYLDMTGKPGVSVRAAREETGQRWVRTDHEDPSRTCWGVCQVEKRTTIVLEVPSLRYTQDMSRGQQKMEDQTPEKFRARVLLSFLAIILQHLPHRDHCWRHFLLLLFSR